MASSPLSRPWGSGNPQNLLPARQHPLIHSVNHTLSLDPSTNNLRTHSPNTAIQQVQTTQHASNPAQSEIDLSANPRLPFLFQLIPLFYFVSLDFMNRRFIRQLTRRAFGHGCGGGARADGRGRGRFGDDSWEEKAAEYDNNSTRLLMCVCVKKTFRVSMHSTKDVYTDSCGLVRLTNDGVPHPYRCNDSSRISRHLRTRTSTYVPRWGAEVLAAILDTLLARPQHTEGSSSTFIVMSWH
jgi:hypothetical protein